MDTLTNKRFKIVLVDDDFDQASMFEIVAKMENVDIAVQKGPLIALEYLDSVYYAVDAVIIDLAMPEMDGISLSRQIRQNEETLNVSPIPLFWYTGWPISYSHDYDPTVNAATELDVKKIFQKPYDAFSLIQEVKELVTISN